MRATRSDDSDEWASRSAQDDNRPVILKREALKNPGCRRTYYGYSLSYGRGPSRAPEGYRCAQDDRVAFRMTEYRSG